MKVSKIIWNGETENWHEGDHLAHAAERAGLDLAELDRAISNDLARYDALIEENQKALEVASDQPPDPSVDRTRPG